MDWAQRLKEGTKLSSCSRNVSRVITKAGKCSVCCAYAVWTIGTPHRGTVGQCGGYEGSIGAGGEREHMQQQVRRVSSLLGR